VRAWLDKQTGEMLRLAADGEPTPEFSEQTHDLMPLSADQVQQLKSGQVWHPGLRQIVDAAPEPAKTPEETAAEAAQAKQAAADAYLARMPPAVLERIADRVAQILAARTRP
jgi:ABC-type transporter Mla subunit MlaD